VQGGVNVQLKHDPTETSWESHGWVSISLDGAELARSEDVQHNRGYGTRQQKMTEMIEQALAMVGGATSKAGGDANVAEGDDAAVAA
jgi:hypothetical protein